MEHAKLKSEIEAYFKEKVKDTDYYDSGYYGFTVEASIKDGGKICEVRLQVANTLYALGDLVSFDNLSWLSKKLGTTKINTDENNEVGCDTCDYGAKSEITITCLDIQLGDSHRSTSGVLDADDDGTMQSFGWKKVQD